MAIPKETAVKTIKSYIQKGDLEAALQQFYDFILPIDTHLSDKVLILIHRLQDLKFKHLDQLISHDEYQRTLNQITKAALELIIQIPDTSVTSNKTSKKRKEGKLLHNISSQMPVHLETMCTVRIAENEEIIKAGIEIDEHTILEDISTSKIMEVSLIDFSDNQNFRIRTLSSKEQVLQAGEFTQWLFFVKPLKEGKHTLYLKVSIIEYVKDEPKKREIVLERKVDVVAQPTERASAPHWQDTNIKIIEAQKKKAGFLSKKIRFLGFTFSILFLFIFSTATLATILTMALLYINRPAQEEQKVKERASQFESTQDQQIESQEQSNDIIINIPGLEPGDELPSNEPPKTEDPEAIIEEPEQVPLEPVVADTTSSDPKNDGSLGPAKLLGFKLYDQLEALDTTQIGNTTFIEVRTSGFKIGKVEFYLGSRKKHPLNPTDRDGKIYFLQLKAIDKINTLTIRDKESGIHISRKLKGNTNYLWKVNRSSNGSIGID